MTFVLIIGGIDLSVGSVLALGAGLLGIAIVQWHWPLWAAVALCVLSGALCGLLSGFLTIRFRLPSFIVTLGLMEAARGATYLVTNSQTMYNGSTIEGVLETGLAQVGAQESAKRMVTGAVIIIAVIVDFYRTRRAEAKSRAG